MGYQLIETVTVGSGGASSIEFTSIPQDGVDLVLVYSGRIDGTNSLGPSLEFNNESANRSYRMLGGDGSSAVSFGNGAFSSLVGGLHSNSSTTANTFGSSQIYISNYSGSIAKSVSLDAVSENNGTAARQWILAGSWNNTSAITSAKLTISFDNMVEHTTASLYKITAD